MPLPVFRKEYRAQFLPGSIGPQNPSRAAALAACKARCETLIGDQKLMTAGLFAYRDMLFAYVESRGDELPPGEIFADLAPLLCDWPGVNGFRKWVPMTPAFYHAVPQDDVDWSRDIPLEKCRGRLAFLKPDKVFDYAHSHKALTDAGELTGDKFLFISLNENILFNYGEGRLIITNIQRDPESWEKKTGHPRFIGELPPHRPSPEQQLKSPFQTWEDGQNFRYIDTLLIVSRGRS